MWFWPVLHCATSTLCPDLISWKEYTTLKLCIYINRYTFVDVLLCVQVFTLNVYSSAWGLNANLCMTATRTNSGLRIYGWGRRPRRFRFPWTTRYDLTDVLWWFYSLKALNSMMITVRHKHTHTHTPLHHMFSDWLPIPLYDITDPRINCSSLILHKMTSTFQTLPMFNAPIYQWNNRKWRKA